MPFQAGSDYSLSVKDKIRKNPAARLGFCEIRKIFLGKKADKPKETSEKGERTWKR